MQNSSQPNLPTQDVSLFHIGTVLLQGRRTLMRFVLGGVVVALGIVLVRPTLYRASTSVIVASSESVDVAQLRGLAGQFGFGGSLGNGSELSPELVVKLVRSPVLLRDIVTDSVVVSELEGQAVAVLDVLKVPPAASQSPKDTERRVREGIKRLGKRLSAISDRRTGMISIAVDSPWPTASMHLLEKITGNLDRSLFQIGRDRASTERISIETRIALQEKRLRVAEGELGSFLSRNKQYESAPELRFAHDRFRREVDLQQQVLVSLAEGREDAFSREVKAAPAMTVLEPPMLPVRPEPRGRLLTLLLGVLSGAFIGMTAVLVTAGMQSTLASGNPEGLRFMAAFETTWFAKVVRAVKRRA